MRVIRILSPYLVQSQFEKYDMHHLILKWSSATYIPYAKLNAYIESNQIIRVRISQPELMRQFLIYK